MRKKCQKNFWIFKIFCFGSTKMSENWPMRKNGSKWVQKCRKILLILKYNIWEKFREYFRNVWEKLGILEFWKTRRNQRLRIPPLYAFWQKYGQKWSFGHSVIHGTTFDHFRSLWRHFKKIPKIINFAIFDVWLIFS